MLSDTHAHTQQSFQDEASSQFVGTKLEHDTRNKGINPVNGEASARNKAWAKPAFLMASDACINDNSDCLFAADEALSSGTSGYRWTHSPAARTREKSGS